MASGRSFAFAIVAAASGHAAAAPDALRASHVEVVGADANAAYQRDLHRHGGVGVVLGRFGSGLRYGDVSVLFRDGKPACDGAGPSLEWGDGAVIDGLEVPSRDPAAAVAWFVQNLGAAPSPGARGVLVGGLKLDFVPGRGAGCGPVDHVAWSHADVAGWTARLERAGVHIVLRERDRVGFDGPDGLRLQIVEAEPPVGRFRCPMHPEVRGAGPGRCPTCGMPLIRATQAERSYHVELGTVPQAVRAGMPAMLRFRIFHPETGMLVRALEEVHEKRLHVFIVSSDLETFEHVHPIPAPDGSWALPIVLPRAVPYVVVSDFYPTGGAPQVVMRTLLPADDRLSWPTPKLVADDDRSKLVDGVQVALERVPAAGVTGELRFRLTRDGAPVRDLERYLGVWAHLMAVDDELRELSHAHPTAAPDDGVVSIAVRFPRRGRYRLWLQLARGGRLSTVPFTVDVRAP